jgi:hypothetical protein
MFFFAPATSSSNLSCLAMIGNLTADYADGTDYW